MFEAVVSGGQTGVERAALDVALALGISCRGWCPKGRQVEDGCLGRRYPLKEAATDDYAQVLEWNIRDSDGTVILIHSRPTPDTYLAVETAKRQRKPFTTINLIEPPLYPAWMGPAPQEILAVNITGPWERVRPGIYSRASRFLHDFLLANLAPRVLARVRPPLPGPSYTCRTCGRTFKETPAQSYIAGGVFAWAWWWECLCGHVAEALYDRIVCQQECANGRIADLIVDDGKIKRDSCGRLLFAETIIEVKRSWDVFVLLATLSRYIQFCNELEMWVPDEFFTQSKEGVFARKQRELEEFIRKANTAGGSQYERAMREELQTIEQLAQSLAPKKVTVVGRSELRRRLSTRNSDQHSLLLKELGFRTIQGRVSVRQT